MGLYPYEPFFFCDALQKALNEQDLPYGIRFGLERNSLCDVLLIRILYAYSGRSLGNRTFSARAERCDVLPSSPAHLFLD